MSATNPIDLERLPWMISATPLLIGLESRA